ncbi:hypothetical protein ACFYVL_01950 [Streptomyces sp. NPDC004111]|uniref:hypothetical protein n=1 Tax=Streptomyces sp. NPDC004111 TaxID=3364690 RepID=UPI0036947CD2
MSTSTEAYAHSAVERAELEVREGAADRVLAVAVRSYTQFGVHARFDSVVTQEVLPALWSTVRDAERAHHPDLLEDFVIRYQERLVRLFASCGPRSAAAVRGRYELLAHPVGLIALERLATVPSALTERWRGTLPDQWLADLTSGWGAATW